MTGFASPDVPAIWCYLLVAILGAWTGRQVVNELLANQPDRWGFAATWTLFAAHLALPLLLYWFLDYTAVIRDTSLFSALIVGGGYRQIFAGAVQGIVMPGQTPALWRPFESWVKRVADQIATEQQRFRERVDDEAQDYLAQDPTRISLLEDLVFSYSADPGTPGRVAALPAPNTPPSSMLRVRGLWGELRIAKPDQYAHLLRAKGAIEYRHYLRLIGRWQARIVPLFVTSGVSIVLLAVSLFLYHDQATIRRLSHSYHQWRFSKATASDVDHFRSREALMSELPVPQSEDQIGNARAVLVPLLRELRFEGLQTSTAEAILRLAVDRHCPAIDTITVPELVEALRNENADVRLRIHRTLLELKSAGYRSCDFEGAEKALANWSPAKGDTRGSIDGYATDWGSWWMRASAAKGLCIVNSSPTS